MLPGRVLVAPSGRHLLLPSRSVPKEAGDVDQHGVEQRRELLGMKLESIDVLGKGRVADLGHPVTDPSHQAGSLVTGEVETSAALEDAE